jgi:hypothetical protein
MLFQVSGLNDDTQATLAALRALDPACRISAAQEPGQLDVQAQLTAEQVVAVLTQAGHGAVRVREALQVHVSGDSTCCGSCG